MSKDRRLSEEAIARRAEVDTAFVRRALAAAALSGDSDAGYPTEDASRLRFLKAWDSAGLSVESVGALLEGAEISFSFLKVPWLQAHPRLDQNYDQLAAQAGVDLETVQAIHESLGFGSPERSDQAREDDLVLIDWMSTFLESGVRPDALLRLLRVYAGSLRRMAQAEAEMYESEVEEKLRAAGSSERDLLLTGGNVGTLMADKFERTLLAIYRRHREHVWLDHSIGHIEILMEAKGLYERLDNPPCVCFIDMTGYTRLTEERGDQTAAEFADRLASLVDRISAKYAGRPVRWLGDGGMFVFPEPGSAAEAAVQVAKQAIATGLPPTHTGIHCGPVVFQDGDIYGRTVNIAARLSAVAGEGDVLISDSGARQLPEDVPLQDLGLLDLKGLAEPLRTYRILQ
jgi:adenylate cyclase